jgi:uncharacterized protein YkwD
LIREAVERRYKPTLRRIISRILVVLLFLLASLTPGSARAAFRHLYLPLLQTPLQWVDTASRAASTSAYLYEYLSSEGVEIGWDGNHNSCSAGSTSPQFRQAVLMRINYFRGMAGVPRLEGLSPAYNAAAQQAALMMSANGSLTHSPPPGWNCYTTAGSQGAGNSNLSLGHNGPSAITGQMRDQGDLNHPVGHRRWILYPQTRRMGTGDVPQADHFRPANALWVFDDHLNLSRPATRDGFVAWPPPGYVPYPLVFPRWSFSYPLADFSQAQVQMSLDGRAVEVMLLPLALGYGENTLVWEPKTAWPAPISEMAFSVLVKNVWIEGSSRSFQYTVVVFNPEL